MPKRSEKQNDSILLNVSDDDSVPVKKLKQRDVMEVFKRHEPDPKDVLENQDSSIKVPVFLSQKINVIDSDEKSLFLNSFTISEFMRLTNLNQLLNQMIEDRNKWSDVEESYIKFVLKSPVRRLLFPGTSLEYKSQEAEQKINTLLIHPKIYNEIKYQEYQLFIKKHDLKECSIDMTKKNPVQDSIINFKRDIKMRDIIKYRNYLEHVILSDYYKSIGQKTIYLCEMTLEQFCDTTNFEDLVEARMKNKGISEDRFEEKLNYYFNELKNNPSIRFLELFRNLIVKPQYIINFNVITKDQEKFLCRTMRHLKYGSNLLHLVERENPGQDQQFYHEKCLEYYMTYKKKPEERKEGIFKNLIIFSKAYKSGNIDEFAAKSFLVKREDSKILLSSSVENKNFETQHGESSKTIEESPSSVPLKNYSFNSKTNSQVSKESSSSDQSHSSNSNETVIYVPLKRKMLMKEYECKVSKAKKYHLSSPNRSLTFQNDKENEKSQETEKNEDTNQYSSSTALQQLNHIDLTSEIQKARIQLSTPIKERASPCLDSPIYDSPDFTADTKTCSTETSKNLIENRSEVTCAESSNQSRENTQDLAINLEKTETITSISSILSSEVPKIVSNKHNDLSLELSNVPEKSNVSTELAEVGAEKEVASYRHNLSLELSIQVAGNVAGKSNSSLELPEPEKNTAETEIAFDSHNLPLQSLNQNSNVAENAIARSLQVASPPPEISNLTTIETSIIHPVLVKEEKLDSNEILETIIKNLKSESNIVCIVLVKTESNLAVGGANFKRLWKRNKDDFIRNFVLNDIVIPKLIFNAIRFKENYDKVKLMEDIKLYHAAVEQEKAGKLADVQGLVIDEPQLEVPHTTPESEVQAESERNLSEQSTTKSQNCHDNSPLTAEIVDQPGVDLQEPQDALNTGILLKESQIKKEKLSEFSPANYSQVEFIENPPEQIISISDDEDQTSSEEMMGARYVPLNDPLLAALEKKSHALPQKEKRFSFDLVASATPERILART